MNTISKVITTALLLGFVFATSVRAGDIKGKVSTQGIKSPEGIAVYVDAIAGKKFDPPAQHALIDQRGMKFVPKVTIVLQGTTVDFQNSDPVGHNVYWPSIGGNKKLAHNLGTWPKGEKKSFQFNDVGAAPLLCNVHPEMAGYIVVASTPYFAVTDKDGNFEIKGIPPGTYTVTTWSEAGKPAIQTVNLTGESTAVELTVKK